MIHSVCWMYGVPVGRLIDDLKSQFWWQLISSFFEYLFLSRSKNFDVASHNSQFLSLTPSILVRGIIGFPVPSCSSDHSVKFVCSCLMFLFVAVENEVVWQYSIVFVFVFVL